MAYQQISARTTLVQNKLGGRTDLVSGSPSRIDNWIKDSYIEIAYKVEFDEMKTTIIQDVGPDADFIAYPATTRAIKVITAYDDNGGVFSMSPTDIKMLRKYPITSSNDSSPGKYAVFGQNIFFRPKFDKTYHLYIDIWQKPTIAGTVNQTNLQVPDDWLEIIDYGAAMRGHAELLERDKAQEIMILLYGTSDPNTGKYTPGLIYQRMNRRQAEAPSYDYGLVPKTVRQGYTSGGR